MANDESRNRVNAVAQGRTPEEHEARVLEYAALVEARGGFNGGGYVFGPRTPTRPLSWLVKLWQEQQAREGKR